MAQPRAAEHGGSKLGELPSTALCGNDITSSCLYVSALCAAQAGRYAPIALGIASQLGLDARPLLVAVAFGASASFATPIGYQTNTLVMGPGGYRFADYLRLGLPMNLLLAVVAAGLIPLFWPL